MVRVARVGAVLAALATLAACGSGTGSTAPTWKPAPSFNGENVVPGNPQPAQPPPGQSPRLTTPPSHAPTTPGQDPNVVASRLSAPTGIAIMPDNTALVGERTTGRILRVQPRPGAKVEAVRTLTGLSTAGGGGLLDLAISPNYSQDNLIFAYLTTPTDNRVVTFTLDGPVTPVLTGIPRGTTDNTGRIVFAPDGSLLVGTGDAGRPSLALDPSSLAGKVLRVTDIGTPAPDNPTPGSRVWTTGHRIVNGLCVNPTNATTFEVETRTTTDPVNILARGASYGWPHSAGKYLAPAILMPRDARSPGGCAVLDGRLFITSRDGEDLLAAPIGSSTQIGSFVPALRKKYGRLLTVVAASDGALWLTTSNRDGHGKPVAADERVLRIVPTGNAADNT
jgi:glucose/arabinose dehydrogenase